MEVCSAFDEWLNVCVWPIASEQMKDANIEWKICHALFGVLIDFIRICRFR